MSKKLMLLALAVVSAAAFALPAGASATEIHLTNATGFSGTAGKGSLTAEGEPVITCLGPSHVTGNLETGGTTGTIHLDFTECHTFVGGFTIKCRTEKSALTNTITTTGTFHLITIVPEKPAILVTPVHTTVICAGISNTTVTGNLIGTITKPKCGETSKSMTIDFNAAGSVQEHKTYTEKPYNLTAQTGTTGTIREAGLSSEPITTESTIAGTLDCT